MHGASNRLHGLNRACFGYFDCAENTGVAKALLDAAEGWARARGLTEIKGNFNLTAPAISPKQRAILDNPDFTFAPITRRNVARRMEQARLILNASFAANPMFVPVTTEEFAFQAKDMKWILDPRISAMLLHKGQPACCVIAVPDMNPLLRQIRSRIGITAPWQSSGTG